ncbi:MAG: prephenate/arogenate dehydrogenase [Phormidesmis sp.]
MKIGIVGLGLIGGCLGLDFKAAGHTVYGVARREHTCEKALTAEAVDVASTRLATLNGCDVVFVCTPIATIVPMVSELAGVLSPEVIVTDVGSVKAALVEAATAQWPMFVGGHPMSGKSEAGIEAAETGLFQGNSYVITPVETATLKTDKGAITTLETLAKQLGSRLYHCSPEVHDRAVAWISHLPVMVSTSLIQSVINEPDNSVQQLAQALASSGFRDTSRVGGGNPELGLMMAQYNRKEVLRSLKRYQQEIALTIEQIEAEDWPAVRQKLEATKAVRSKFL